MKPNNSSIRSWILAFTAATTLAVHAVEYTWDSSAAAGIQTTNGNWATTASTWTTDGGVSNVTWPNTGTDSAYVTGLLTADLYLNINSADIQLDDLTTDYTSGTPARFGYIRQLNPGSRTLTLTGGTYDGNAAGNTGSQFSITGAPMGLISGNGVILAGTSDLVKKGTGQLNLASINNTFTGNIYAVEGTINLNSAVDSTLGNADNDIFIDGGILKQQNTAVTLGSSRSVTLKTTGGAIQTDGTLTLQGPITGPAGLNKTGGGALQLEGACDYAGTTTIVGGVLRPQVGGTIPSNSDLTITSVGATGNFNVRNTIGWVYNGTISGDNTGQINLNSGTDATLAGPISGVAIINANSAGTNTAITGDISGSALVRVQNTGGAILRLSGTNSYTGDTIVDGGGTPGTLIINGDNSGATGLVTINAGGTLAGSGTIGSATTINGTHSPGNSPGVQTFKDSIGYTAGSTLSIDVWTNSSAPGARGASPFGYAGANVTGGVLAIDPATNGRVALDSETGNVNLSNAFWGSPQSWRVVDVGGTATAADTNIPTLSGVSLNGSNFNSAAYGTFSFSRAPGSTAQDSLYLDWTPAVVPTWTGSTNVSWGGANWTPAAPGIGDIVRFTSASIANLNTVLNVPYDLMGLAVLNPTGPVSIGGPNILTLGSGGIDLSFATQNLTISAPVALASGQTWSVGSGRTLSVTGGVGGTGALGIGGAGTVSLGGTVGPLVGISVSSGGTLKMEASNVLSSDPLASNVAVNGTLDLSGTSQSINGLSGTGIVDNTAGAASVMTLGNNDVATVFTGTIQNSNGTLALVKTGTGVLTMNGANTFSGGFTNNGSGIVRPNSDTALGTGPVVSNAGQVYPTNTTVFSNTLALNNSTLRIGGGGGNTVTWTGPVTTTGASGINGDGDTIGVTLTNNLNIGGTFTSFANGGTNTISGAITGGGEIAVTSGSLNLEGTGTYAGATTLSNSAVFRLQSNATITGNVVINSAGNFNIRNTVGWVHTGTITGDDTGQININTGTDAELAGDISGVVDIKVNNAGTDTTISGDISGGTNVIVQATGGAILRLSGNNSHTGDTTVFNTGILVLESASALSDVSALIIGNSTLDAQAAGTDNAGSLNVTNTATLNLAAGAKLAFADSSAIPWTGSLNVTGTFVSGSSLKFGIDGSGLDSAQLAVITADGFEPGSFALDGSGFLTATAVGGGYSTWALTNAPLPQTPDQDFDGDGVTNGVEYVVGGTALTKDLGKLPTVSSVGGNFVFTFQRDQSSTDALTQIEVGTTLATWPTVVTVLDNLSVQEPGVTVVDNPGNPGFDTVTLTISQALAPKKFARLKVTP